jgi:hypothetical protein
MQWYGLIIEIENENGGGELLKRDCLIRRHLKVIMVVDGDEEEEEVTHVFPITCVEPLSEKCLIALRGGKIGTLWTPDHVDDLRWRVEIDEDQSRRI